MREKMKRLWTVLLCVAVIFTATPAMAVYAEENAEPTISVTEQSVYPNNSATLYVKAADISDMAGIEFSVYYDDSVLKLDSCSVGSFLSNGGFSTNINEETSGVIRVLAGKDSGISGSGTVLTMSFKANSDAKPGVYPVTLAVGSVYNSTFGNIEVKTVQGKITVQERSASTKDISFCNSCSTTTLQQDDELTYKLVGESSYNLAGGNLIFTYDKVLLKLVKAELGTALSDSPALCAINKDTAGMVKVSFAGNEILGASSGEEYVVLTFKAKRNVDDSTEIKFEASGLMDIDLVPMAAKSLSQKITFTKKEVIPDNPDFAMTDNSDFDIDTRTFSVDVSLQEGAGVAAGDFAISYDKSKIKCIEAVKNNEVSEAGGIIVINETVNDGAVRFSYVNTEPFDTEIKLLTLKFQAVNDYVGTTAISASGSDTVDIDVWGIQLDYPETTISVPKLKASVTGTDTYEKSYGDALFTLDAGTTNRDKEAQLTYLSSNENVAQVNENGEVLVIGAGTAKITVSCAETTNYFACSKEVTVNVEQADISSKTLVVAGPVEYNGKPQEPTVTLEQLVLDLDFSVAYNNNVNAGTANVIVSGKGNYKGTLEGTFVITPANLGLSEEQVQIGEYDKIYDGTAKEPKITISGLTENVDFTVSYANNIEEGRATVTISGIGNYAGEIQASFEIVKLILSKVSGTAISWNNTDDAVYLLYAGTTADSVIRTEWKDNSYGTSENVLNKDCTKGDVSANADTKRWDQSFSFSGVSEGTYKLAILKPGHGIWIETISVGNGDISGKNITLYMYGDVNGDGKVKGADKMILARYLAKWEGYETLPVYEAVADLNCDGKVKGADKMILARYLAKWTGYETLPKM